MSGKGRDHQLKHQTYAQLIDSFARRISNALLTPFGPSLALNPDCRLNGYEPRHSIHMCTRHRDHSAVVN